MVLGKPQAAIRKGGTCRTQLGQGTCETRAVNEVKNCRGRGKDRGQGYDERIRQGSQNRQPRLGDEIAIYPNGSEHNFGRQLKEKKKV